MIEALNSNWNHCIPVLSPITNLKAPLKLLNGEDKCRVAIPSDQYPTMTFAGLI